MCRAGRVRTRAGSRTLMLRRGACGDRGSAVLEFVLVTPLVLLVALGVLQVALFLHVRTTLTAAAAEGARVAALHGSSLAAGERRVRTVLDGSLSSGALQGVSAQRQVVAGMPVAAVTVEARVPLLGLLGPSGLRVTGHAVLEPGR
jgi:Flp pilus assembly protein TadG